MAYTSQKYWFLDNNAIARHSNPYKAETVEEAGKETYTQLYFNVDDKVILRNLGETFDSLEAMKNHIFQNS